MGEPSQAEWAQRCAPYAHKLKWFHERGYGRHYDRTLRQQVVAGPHLHQTMFHTMQNPETGHLCAVRSLVAGRRGGKTLSAAWEVAYYLEHPQMFHHDFHGEEDERPLHGWVISTTNIVARAALLTLRRCRQVGGLNWLENRSDRYFELAGGGLLEFKTAVEPQNLRGMGLDFIWWDEAAYMTDREAYDVATPALDDHEGIVINTTTPDGKNWFYDEFFSEAARADPDQGQVEYRSIDNPYFPLARWKLRRASYHPMLFKQEYEASFDSMAGKELPGRWLTDHFYTLGRKDDGGWDVPRKGETQELDLEFYLGVDPAISLADDADSFAMCLGGVHKATGHVYLLQTYKERIPFAEQVDVVNTWFHKYRPTLIGIESQAYQAALAQQVMRLEGMPPVVPMLTSTKKRDRILSMSVLFKVGRARVKETHHDFIEEWLAYDSLLKNPKDDLLDATEIMLRTAGALLPISLGPSRFGLDDPAMDADELAKRDLPKAWDRVQEHFDPILGAEW